MNNIPFKYETKAKPYKPLGLPKVRMSKIGKVEVKFPKVKHPRIKILDRRIN